MFNWSAASQETDTVDGRAITVIPTTVETFSASGALTQRLRERFAISLADGHAGHLRAIKRERASGVAAVHPDADHPGPTVRADPIACAFTGRSLRSGG
jgi:hypothetical protein